MEKEKKKPYKKPEIIIEEFRVSDAYALACTNPINFSSDCYGNALPDTILGGALGMGGFTEDRCMIPMDEDAYNGLCVHSSASASDPDGGPVIMS